MSKLQLSRSSKIFGILLSSSVIIHLITWPLMHLSEGKVWIYGERLIQQYKLFSPSIDGGYFEHFQYILLVWCSSLSFLIFLRQSKYIYPIPIIYLFLFIDDALSIHDYVFGNKLIPYLKTIEIDIPSIIRLKDVAEISYWFFIFLACLLLVYPSIKKANQKSREFIYANIKIFFALAFFASFIDLLGANLFKIIPLDHSSAFSVLIHGSFIFIEEAGEIGVITFACIWLFDNVLNKKLVNKC